MNEQPPSPPLHVISTPMPCIVKGTAASNKKGLTQHNNTSANGPSEERAKGYAHKKRATISFMSEPELSSQLAELAKNFQNSVEDTLLEDDDGQESESSMSDEDETRKEGTIYNSSQQQQLRGIFAAHDEDNNGFLTKQQLEEALRSLGFDASSELLQRFTGSETDKKTVKETNATSIRRRKEKGKGKRGHMRNSWKIDFPTFYVACQRWLPTANNSSKNLKNLFSHFKETRGNNIR